ncbi:hypothetical protein [Legionella hackeliae]|uniref:Uncharacterized protein n=1 Tax=Legionella hackeliae TaxID=449 RepID=A0A0A8UTN1_LEGHA|nr:hypothetical protein [Legionella hackeliae]KTD12791.1 hypothetical protein Lhac_1662 [Legionella hackeliae]CEK12215.1 protein of unknown function [Legionella hackeliae]STX49001.1 Uncharacterised protein [Legionella hackeliae]
MNILIVTEPDDLHAQLVKLALDENLKLSYTKSVPLKLLPSDSTLKDYELRTFENIKKNRDYHVCHILIKKA